MPVEYLTVYATDCGETLEDARAQAKQEIDRINKGDAVSLPRIQARAICTQKGTQKQENQVRLTQGTDPDFSDKYTILRFQRAKIRGPPAPRTDILRTLNLPVTHFW